MKCNIARKNFFALQTQYSALYEREEILSIAKIYSLTEHYKKKQKKQQKNKIYKIFSVGHKHLDVSKLKDPVFCWNFVETFEIAYLDQSRMTLNPLHTT